ncbi:MAG TPA: glycosyltransferase [Gemmatimonadales bacterium]|nr:glycosyltransferase [Gemmatimonadales bacterium]
MVDTLVVIPCYNEAGRLPVQEFERFLAGTSQVGFVLVNDGSRDETLKTLNEIAGRHPGRVDVLDLQPNSGKSEAVRRGILFACERNPRYTGFWDADLATPLSSIMEFRDVLETRPEVDWAIGARVRLLGRRVDRKAVRHWLGRVFATLASFILKIAVYDTQCGAKLFRRDQALALSLKESFPSRWFFDVELIGRFLNLWRDAGDPHPEHRIVEVPLQTWIDVAGSKLHALDFVRASWELGGIWWRLSSGSRLVGETSKLSIAPKE